MSEFYIKKGSLNPILRVEAIQTGRNKPFLHFYEILQDSEIFFSMRNLNTGIVKVANAKCYIKRADDDGCEEKYLICYNWKKYDVDEYGVFEGEFNVKFNGNIECNDYSYPKGNLILPIGEKLFINVV
jgi:hypothetical protein